jgi:hypothetical protein
MTLFTVLSNCGVHHDCIAVFKTLKQAEGFLENKEVHQGYIKAVEIAGEYTYPDDVYEANIYLKEWNVHTFIGLYANYTDAEIASGENGLVMPRSFEKDAQ